MAKAKKLPSGNWRVRESVKKSGGGYTTKSFTASSRLEAERLGREWKATHDSKIEDMTVGEAIERYITARTATCSPATIKGYRSVQRAHFEDVRNIRLSRLTNEDIARTISGYKGKTAQNVAGLLMAAIRFFDPTTRLYVKLPPKERKEPKLPTTEQMDKLLEISTGDLHIAIILGAFGTCRRSEACALRYKDVDSAAGYISITRAMVQDENKQWIIKDYPKTEISRRRSRIPCEFFDEIGEGAPEEFIISVNPNIISKRFDRLAEKLGIDCSFHGLRHFAASWMHARGIPDQYIQSQGGWSTDGVMQRIYRNTIGDIEERYREQIARDASAEFGRSMRQKEAPERGKIRGKKRGKDL